MPSFNPRKQKRFDHAVKLLKSLKECAEKGNNLQLTWQGELIKPSQIGFDTDYIYVKTETKGSIGYHAVFDESCLDRSMKQTEQIIRSEFKLLREIPW